MKDWIIVFVQAHGTEVKTVKAESLIDAIYNSAVPVRLIVSVQCVNTRAPV